MLTMGRSIVEIILPNNYGRCPELLAADRGDGGGGVGDLRLARLVAAGDAVEVELELRGEHLQGPEHVAVLGDLVDAGLAAGELVDDDAVLDEQQAAEAPPGGVRLAIELRHVER